MCRGQRTEKESSVIISWEAFMRKWALANCCTKEVWLWYLILPLIYCSQKYIPGPRSNVSPADFLRSLLWIFLEKFVGPGTQEKNSTQNTHVLTLNGYSHYKPWITLSWNRSTLKKSAKRGKFWSVTHTSGILHCSLYILPSYLDIFVFDCVIILLHLFGHDRDARSVGMNSHHGLSGGN